MRLKPVEDPPFHAIMGEGKNKQSRGDSHGGERPNEALSATVAFSKPPRISLRSGRNQISRSPVGSSFCSWTFRWRIWRAALDLLGRRGVVGSTCWLEPREREDSPVGAWRKFGCHQGDEQKPGG